MAQKQIGSKQKIINGRKYTSYHIAFSNKGDAQSVASHARAGKGKARVIKEGKYYTTYKDMSG